jgi:tetratricopeptide (TPR) repeat protein
MVKAENPRETAGRRMGWLGGVALAAAALISAFLLWWLLAPDEPFDANRAVALALSGRFDEAERLLRARIRRAPGDAQAHFRLAELLLERPEPPSESDAQQALNSLERAASADPRDPTVKPALLALYRGKAHHVLKQWDRAEAAWLNALRLDPAVPEAGQALLDLYYIELRRREARELGLRLFEVEPNPRDRALLLLTLVRQDAIKPESTSLVQVFEPVLRAEPDGLHTAVALGLSLVRSGEAERGLELLRAVVGRHRDDAAAWEGLLAGLDLAPRADEVAATLAELPAEMAAQPRFARFRGLAAQQRGDWPAAAAAYREAVAADPTDFESLVRLARALKLAGQTEEAEATEAAVARQRETVNGLLALYDEAGAVPTLGEAPHPALCERLAAAREAMGRPDEAAAWRRLAPGAAATR